MNRSERVQPRLLRTKDAAAYLGVSDKRIRQLVLAGKLRFIQFGTGANSPFLIDKEQLDRLIAESQISLADAG